jgi:hypothetical protein
MQMLPLRTRCFITEIERNQILEKIATQDLIICSFFEALKQRVYERVDSNFLNRHPSPVQWYYPAAEYLSDAALIYCLYPEEKLAAWLRIVTLNIARKPVYDWVGPLFRDHSQPYTGNLETAHLCWGLSVVLDLAEDIYEIDEKNEVKQAIIEKGLKLCIQWVKKNAHLANWRGIMVSGVVVPAAVLGQKELLDSFIPELQRCMEAFQPDGSYAESLQYGNYLSFALMLGYESVIRKYPELAGRLQISSYGKGITWVVNSMLYKKPMDGWGEESRARAANFNDSAALFRPSGDLLLHLAVRHTNAIESRLACWLFETYYKSSPYQGPHDLATFGMRNDWGFLTLPLLTYPIKAITSKEADLPLTTSFSNGHSFTRDKWDGKTILAINAGGDKLFGPGHLHGDVNSFLLVHNQERLLVDPGHSCYRNLIHGLEASTQTHNTCTFLVDNDQLGLQEDLSKATLFEQKSIFPRRLIKEDLISDPIDRKNKQLIISRDKDISIIGSEAAGVYGDPVENFSRFWILAGSHVLFVIDRIKTTREVKVVWNWLVNNRDSKTLFESKDSCLTIKRGKAGMKLFQAGENTLSFPVYSYVHDAYHVEPNQLGEGKPGSGLLFRHTEKEKKLYRTVVHCIALDEPAFIDSWDMITEGNKHILTNGSMKWTITVQDNNIEFLTITSGKNASWIIVETEVY